MTITDSARRLALVAVVAMLAALLPLSGAFAQDPPADDEPVVVDLEAEDADDATGISTRISQFTFESSTEGLLGRDDVFADSLASGSLQGGGRPLLLTGSDSLDARVVDEFNRLGVETVHILGLEDAISADVEQELQDAGFETNRFGGETRIETAVDIAEFVEGDTAILARAFANDDPTQAFADSLAAGGWAAEDQTPVLLTQTEVLTGNTAAHIEAAGYSNIIVVGGESAVSEDVVAEVEALGATVTRVAGDTRFETAVAIANARGFEDSSDAEFTIVGDGQGGDAWVGGFAAAALSGLTPAPIVLGNSADPGNLPAPTADFLVDETGDAVADPAFAEDPGATFVLVDQDGNVVAVCLPDLTGADCEAVEDETGATSTVVPPRPGDSNVTVDVTEVEAGGDITVTVADAQPGDEIVISGCGVDQTVTISEDHEGDAPITVTIPANQAEGDCELSVTVNGEEQGPFTITVTEPAGNETATTRPELVRAQIGELVTTQQATASNPAGLRVTYTFDEPISQVTGSGNFYIWNSNGTLASGALGAGGGTATISTTDNTMVTVRFASITTQSAADNITLASTGFNAVADFQGQQNPEGSAAVGTASDTTTLTAGVTDAPDLLSVGGFRAASNGTQTAVDFTFDEAAFVTGAGMGSAGVSDFYLIPVDGTAPYIRCDAPAPGSATAGGQAAVGGNGTTTITVNCDNNAGQTSTTLLNSAVIARGVVEQAAVTDATTNPNNPNPLQTADISNGGNTTNPDLVAAALQLDASVGGSARDAVVYQFDQAPGTPPVASNFRAYLSNGQEVLPCGAAGSTCVTNDAPVLNGNVVTVYYGDSTLSNATGASLRINAVPGDGSAGVLGNDEDEVGVTNGTLSGRSPGLVAGPQLVSASVERATVPLGEGPFQVRYLFDSDVNAAVVNGNFYIYQSNGDRNAASNCSRGGAGANNQVVCTAYTGITNNSNIGSAVLATVDAGAVTDSANRINPHDAEVLSGSTGTPAS